MASDKQVPETVWYLEMRDPGELRPPKRTTDRVHLSRAMIPCIPLNWFFYCSVGKPWNWTDRLAWSPKQWEDFVHNPKMHTWVGCIQGTPVGYAELLGETSGDVAIESFGLLPQFVGMGIGGELLTKVVQAAWARPASRVWLHTCSFDHPNALHNYEARGFKIYDTHQQAKSLPEQPVAHPF